MYIFLCYLEFQIKLLKKKYIIIISEFHFTFFPPTSPPCSSLILPQLEVGTLTLRHRFHEIQTTPPIWCRPLRTYHRHACTSGITCTVLTLANSRCTSGQVERWVSQCGVAMALLETSGTKDGLLLNGQEAIRYTRKTAHVVPDLQARCNKAVDKPISGCVRTACSQLLCQVWNKLLTSCNKADESIKLVTSCPNKSNTVCS